MAHEYWGKCSNKILVKLTTADKIRQKSKEEMLNDVDKIFRQLPPRSLAPPSKQLDEVICRSLL